MARRPNILLIFTDQQRADTISALGNPAIRTPNLDRLASEGTAFTSAFTPSAECVPSRCGLAFGQYPTRLDCVKNGDPMPWGKIDSYLSALGRAGYRTHGIGKCHFDRPGSQYDLRDFQSREYQEEIADSPDRDDYLRFLRAHGFGHLTDPHGVRGEMYYVPQVAQMPASLHPTQWVGDRACAFISEQKGSKTPWHLFASFIHPHPPFAPPAPWHKLYRDLDVPPPHLPCGCQRLLLPINHIQNRYKRRDRGYDFHLVRVIRAYYYACVSFVDFQIGRILKALDDTGQMDNTLIIFTSDHGELLGDFFSFGKRSYHDPVVKVPLLCRLPGVFPAGRRCATPVSLVDVTATMLGAAGAALRDHSPDGEDLRGTAGAADRDRTVFSQWNRAGSAVYLAVTRNWKYVYSAADHRELLFDRLCDHGETRDLADATRDMRRPEARAQDALRRKLVSFLASCGAKDAVEGDGFRTYPAWQPHPNPDSGLLYQDHPWADTRIPGYTSDTD